MGSQLERYFQETRALAVDADENLVPSNPHLLYILEAAQGELLNSLDSIVHEHQLESERKTKALLSAQRITLILSFLMLLIIAIFVFRPMVKKIIEEKLMLETMNQKLSRLSVIDGLTGIANRRSFDEYYINEWKRAVRDKSNLSVIMCDIDFFKIYNDTYGHMAGDDCLKMVAVTLRDSLSRPADFVARYGGEEFVLVLPNTDKNGALVIAERLRLAVESKNLEHINSVISNRVTLSLGVASTVPTVGQLPETLVDSADKALYKAKNDGRNRVAVS